MGRDVRETIGERERMDILTDSLPDEREKMYISTDASKHIESEHIDTEERTQSIRNREQTESIEKTVSIDVEGRESLGTESTRESELIDDRETERIESIATEQRESIRESEFIDTDSETIPRDKFVRGRLKTRRKATLQGDGTSCPLPWLLLALCVPLFPLCVDTVGVLSLVLLCL